MPFSPQCHTQSATIHAGGKYRHDLRRFWGPKPYCLWIMLNPSTADAKHNDPTIKKTMGFTDRFGFNGMVVVNLFDYRATDPKDLLRAESPLSGVNDLYIRGWATKTARVIVGWGAHGKYRGRGREVGEMLQSLGLTLWCLRTNDDGHPGHPLFIPFSTELKLWTPDMIR